LFKAFTRALQIFTYEFLAASERHLDRATTALKLRGVDAHCGMAEYDALR
jgi:hypothetical protein